MSLQESAPACAEAVPCAGGVDRNPPAVQAGDAPANGSPALQLSPRDLTLRVVPPAVSAELFVRHHYLHSAPAGVKLALGVFAGDHLSGAVALNAGPLNGWRLVDGARREDCLCLARLWLADDLPRNSESRVLGLVVRVLRRHTTVKFLVSYADPAAGHIGTIYQAAGWLYTGTAEAQPLMDLGDGIPRHTRSIASVLGTHSAAYFRRQGMDVQLVATIPKHRYLMFVDPSWRPRLRVPVLPYAKKGGGPDGHP